MVKLEKDAYSIKQYQNLLNKVHKSIIIIVFELCDKHPNSKKLSSRTIESKIPCSQRNTNFQQEQEN